MFFEHWFIPAILCAVFYGMQSAYVKELMSRVHFFLITWANVFFAVPLLGGMLYQVGLPEIQSGFLVYFLISLTINAIAWPLFVLAIRHADISLVMPLLAFTPVFILGIEWILRDTGPGLLGGSGILLIVAGAYVLNLRNIEAGLLAPIKKVFEEKGATYMLIVAVLWSVSATVEKFTVDSSSPTFYLTTINIALSIVFLPMLFWFVDRPMQSFSSGWNSLWLVGVGVINALMGISQMIAIRETPLVNFVISIKRAGMFVSVLIGWLYFQEKHILFRMAGAILMIFGVFLIRIH